FLLQMPYSTAMSLSLLQMPYPITMSLSLLRVALPNICQMAKRQSLTLISLYRKFNVRLYFGFIL
ncbi:MAG: hypothetical protein RSE10_09190, partial [Oscillospiraceae bacterium]